MTERARRLGRLLGIWLLAVGAICAIIAGCSDAPAPAQDASRAAADRAAAREPAAAAPASPGAASKGEAATAARGSAPAGANADAAAPRRDLDADERCGGHTLERHVGWTDAQLADRLRRQRDIAAASTYTDRATAERIVAAALADDADRVRRWTARQGRRPNLTLRYRAGGGLPIGRSLRRGTDQSVPCFDALVVLRWREDLDDFCVLTSYPEVRR